MREPIVNADEQGEQAEPQPSASGAGRRGPPSAVGGDTGGSDDGGDDPPGFTGGALWMEHFGRWYNMPIEDLNLSMRPYNWVRRSGIMTIGQILERTEEELLAITNLGRNAYDELRDKLDAMGILRAPSRRPGEP